MSSRTLTFLHQPWKWVREWGHLNTEATFSATQITSGKGSKTCIEPLSINHERIYPLFWIILNSSYKWQATTLHYLVPTTASLQDDMYSLLALTPYCDWARWKILSSYRKSAFKKLGEFSRLCHIEVILKLLFY